MSTQSSSNPSAGAISDGATAVRAQQLATGIIDAIRGQVRRIDTSARGIVRRTGNRMASFMGAKIKRRVKPPIVLAIVLAALALAAAVVAIIRK